MSVWTGAVYPSRRAIVLAAAGVPLSLIAGLTSPGLWVLGIAWSILVLCLVAADILLSAWGSELRLESLIPTRLGLGAAGEAQFCVAFQARRSPAKAGFALQTNALIRAPAPSVEISLAHGAGEARFGLETMRRGRGELKRLWVRWEGPLGLVWKQHVEQLGAAIAVVPNIEAVKEEAIRLFQRNEFFGFHMQHDMTDGGEFHALRDFGAGMDRRTIDWKQSAKHAALLAKEFRAERNQQVVIALDTGHLMCEPLAGQPRIDRALHAALLLIFAALKIGDRAGLYAFDSKPRLSSGTVSGTRSFSLLQQLAAKIDYTADETNFTLGLTQLSGQLERRSLIVVFTDFADSTSAELMLENVERLLRRHLVLFVVFRDEQLETLADKEPREAADISRAVIADTMLREREVVIVRLRRMGAEIVETAAERAGPNLLAAYFALKRRNMI